MSVYQDYYLSPKDYERAKKNGISKKLLYSRFYEKAWSKERAITQPKRNYNKECKYIKQAKENGIGYKLYYKRMQMGWSKKRASNEPITIIDEDFMKEITKKSVKKTRKYPNWVYESLEKNNISRITFYKRVNKLKWSLEDAATTPTMRMGGKREANEIHVWRTRTQL